MFFFKNGAILTIQLPVIKCEELHIEINNLSLNDT